MNMIKQLMEMMAEQEDQKPNVGDLIHNPQKTALTQDYGTIKSISGSTAKVSIGGPDHITVNLSKFHSPTTFNTTDPVWKDLNGKKTIWKIKLN